MQARARARIRAALSATPRRQSRSCARKMNDELRTRIAAARPDGSSSSSSDVSGSAGARSARTRGRAEAAPTARVRGERVAVIALVACASLVAIATLAAVVWRAHGASLDRQAARTTMKTTLTKTESETATSSAAVDGDRHRGAGDRDTQQLTALAQTETGSVAVRARATPTPRAPAPAPRSGPTSPPPYYAAWAPVTGPRASVLRQDVMVAARSPIVWQSPTFCFYTHGGAKCAGASDTPFGQQDDFNCTNVANVTDGSEGSFFREDAQHALCGARSMQADGSIASAPCYNIELAESDNVGGKCGTGFRLVCQNKQISCALMSWNEYNKPACCAGVVDTLYASVPQENGANQIALTCAPTWYLGSDDCNAEFASHCFGPTNNAAGEPHALLANGAEFPCADYFGAVRAWMQMGETAVAPVAADIAAEVQRHCAAEGAASAACKNVAGDWT